jgi:hypothetical protein
MAMGFPGLAQFHYGLDEEEYRLNEQTLFAAEDILAVAPSGRDVILVNGGLRIPGTLHLRRQLRRIPVEGGNPSDDGQAIRELEALRSSGAGLIAFLWPAYWWLDYYSEFSAHLSSSYRRVLQTDRVIAFDLAG